MSEHSLMASADSPVQTFEVIIVGDGLVAKSLACALAMADISVALVSEKSTLNAPAQPADLRPIALASSSVRILEALGAWTRTEVAPSPIRRIHVSERGSFGVTRLRADDFGFAAFGHVVAAGVLGAAIAEKLTELASVSAISPAHINTIETSEDGLQLHCHAVSPGASLRLQGQLVVVADDGQARLLEALSVQRRHHDYQQVALTATVVTELDHHQTAFERFTPDGPIALLPLTERRCGLVWSLPAERGEEIASYGEAAFLGLLEQQFGTRLGKLLVCDQRVAHHLMLTTSDRIVAKRSVLVGNAANRLHPVAGQGLNLGLRDVAVLAEQVIAARDAGVGLGDESVLERYRQMRVADHARTVRFTDGVIRIFTNACPPIAVLRNLGLIALDTNQFFKRAFVMRAMGLAGRQSRLARGLCG